VNFVHECYGTLSAAHLAQDIEIDVDEILTTAAIIEGSSTNPACNAGGVFTHMEPTQCCQGDFPQTRTLSNSLTYQIEDSPQLQLRVLHAPFESDNSWNPVVLKTCLLSFPDICVVQNAGTIRVRDSCASATVAVESGINASPLLQIPQNSHLSTNSELIEMRTIRLTDPELDSFRHSFKNSLASSHPSIPNIEDYCGPYMVTVLDSSKQPLTNPPAFEVTSDGVFTYKKEQGDTSTIDSIETYYFDVTLSRYANDPEATVSSAQESFTVQIINCLDPDTVLNQQSY
jgi:hypothetical protein